MYYTECVRPEGLEPELFADREEDRENIKRMIATAIRAKGIEGIRLLGTGDRGVGKSILFRKVLEELHQESEFIYVAIDGRECRDEVDMLKKLCKTICGALREKFRDDDRVLAEAAYIEDVVEKSKITRKNATSILNGIKVMGGVEVGIVTFLKTKMGITSEIAEREEVSDQYEFDVNASFLLDLLNSVIETVTEKQKILFFIDNLDQIYDKERISEFLRLLLAMKKPVVVTTVRTEALSNELRRDFRRIVPVKELGEDALIKILEKRLEVCDEEDRESINKEQLFKVADALKTLTGNPLTFLTWIEFLCNNTELNIETTLEDLRRYAVTHFYDFRPEELEKISRFFLKQGNTYKEKKEILESDFSEGLFDRLYERGVLVASDIYNPRHYRLAPEFAFFKEL
jgi:Cdc6-like AAA superfamily ATPase